MRNNLTSQKQHCFCWKKERFKTTVRLSDNISQCSTCKGSHFMHRKPTQTEKATLLTKMMLNYVARSVLLAFSDNVIDILIRILNQEALKISLSLLLRMKTATIPLRTRNLLAQVMTSLQTRKQEYYNINRYNTFDSGHAKYMSLCMY